jgi:toxin-antitoxin system PIN domain toxin
LSGRGLLFDVNVWVALAFPAHPDHARALQAYAQASAARPAVFCRATQQSFLRLASTPAFLRLCGSPHLTNRDALAALAQFSGLPSVGYRDEPAGTVQLWHRLGGLPSPSPKVWMDAYLAAFAIAGRLEMATFAGDFKSFEKDGLILLAP